MILFKKFLPLSAIFLTACSVKTPVGPVNVSGTKYYCRGEWHYPQNYYEYDEVGLGSWYGDKFQGRPKATGEKFDKLEMTAAHRTLPIPSVARVTSLKTGKSIIVVVDDRGPFCYKGRIIDLSYGAAKSLGIHNSKPSTVRIQVLVSDSLVLSRYIAKNCKKRKDPSGRSWAQLYFQEIRKSTPVHFFPRSRNISTEATSQNQPKIPQKKKSIIAFKKTNSSKVKKKRYNNLGSYLKKI
ncbi:MAG: septal ring lytic transglycosylase RlpA family protein [Holosporales bacterium]|jgi:rare lipoprotein A (peptidoglycan hydrolase)|nr:septal ring lytic transglycosylase RlpA family protein [Holosporales bacterium]